MRRGAGVLTCRNGDVYTGDWAVNMRNGKGVCAYVYICVFVYVDCMC